jgi:hypothetical protein
MKRMNMYTYKLRYCLVLALFFTYMPGLLPACATRSSTVMGSSVLASKTYTFDDSSFTKIKTDGIGSIAIKVGGTNKVIVEAEDNIIPLLEVYVEGSTLVISQKSSFRTTKTVHYVIELTTETLQAMHALTSHGSASVTVADESIRFAQRFHLHCTGSCNVRFSDALSDAKTVHITSHGGGHIKCETLHADELEIASTGSGSIEVDTTSVKNVHIDTKGSGQISCATLTAHELKITSRGSGAIEISDGRVKKATIHSHGSGHIDMHALPIVDTIDLSLNGSASVDCLTRGTIKANIKGSGSVTNYAHAQSKKIKKSGSGRYREKNRTS